MSVYQSSKTWKGTKRYAGEQWMKSFLSHTVVVAGTSQSGCYGYKFKWLLWVHSITYDNNAAAATTWNEVIVF